MSQTCQTVCDPMNYTVHGILQTRILEWVAFPFSRRSSKPRDQTQVSPIACRFYLSHQGSPIIKYAWCLLFGRKAMTNLNIILENRHYFASKSPSSQSFGFSSSHVCMWELDCEETWVPNNWCFRTVVLEKILESPLDCKEIQPVNPKRKSVLNIHWKDWCWNWNSNILATDEKNWFIWKDPDAGKDWGQEEKGTTEVEMVG